MIDSITPLELKRRLAGDPGELLLLDVREPEEYSVCRIEGSRHIPMSEVMQHLDRLDRNADIVVICHHGVRSLQVARMLAHYGFERISNLQGGIDAWAVEADPSTPRY